MKATKVEYTVKEEFAAQNKTNIQKVMEELKGLNAEGIAYSAWVKEDGKSFVHLVAINEGVKNSVPDMESFKYFQTELKQNIGTPPQAIELAQGGASFSL